MTALEPLQLHLTGRNLWHFRANRSIHHSMHNCVGWHGPYSLRQTIPLRRLGLSLPRSAAVMSGLKSWLIPVLVALPLAFGCRQQRPPVTAPYDNSAMEVALTRVEYPDVEAPSRDTVFPVEPPRTLRNLADIKY